MVIPTLRKTQRDPEKYNKWVDTLSRDEYRLHVHREVEDNQTHRMNDKQEYKAIRGRFKDGKLQILLREGDDKDSKNAFYVDMDESTHNRGLIELVPNLRITGKPIKWKM